MELIPDKDLEIINRRLKEYYGQTDDKQHFRLVWSDSQLEKRLVFTTQEGLELAHPVMTLMQKYSYIHARYVLERLTVVPEFQQAELIDKISYEPVWTFEKTNQQREKIYVRPSWEACRFVIETIMEQVRVRDYTKYKDPDSNPEEARERELIRLDELQKELFGDETPITDALSVGEGVGYGPISAVNYRKENK